MVVTGDGLVDWFVPLEVPRAQIRDATHFRTTWLTASQTSIRERGHGARYEAALESKYKDQLLTLVAAAWVPMPVARAHYQACDALGLSTAEMLDVGMAATRRMRQTTLAVVVRLAQGVGVNPWTVLAQTPRMWARTCQGGAVAVARLGPKEALMEVIGYPLADITYNRVTFRGILHAVVELSCQKAYVREVASLCGPRTLGMRLSWV